MLAEGAGAPLWVAEVSWCEQFHWTEKQLREENTVGFVRKISLYNELSRKAAKAKDQKGYEPAKPKVNIIGGKHG